MKNKRLAEDVKKLSYYFPKGEIIIKQDSVNTSINYTYRIKTFKDNNLLVGKFNLSKGTTIKDLDNKVCRIMQEKL